jgi:ADP-heptose:LPS heptosyltransferase
VVANTGPAHLSAAVGTPVVSLFAPVVSALRWAPFGVSVELLGDQHAPCKDTRWTSCQIDGHPCLTSVSAEQIVSAVRRLSAARPVGQEMSIR